MSKLFLRTGHKKDTYFACAKVTGKTSKENLKKDGYMIVSIFYNMEKANDYIKEKNSFKVDE